MSTVTQFVVGDTVALRAAFLRSIGNYSYDSASLRGTVTEHVLRLPLNRWVVRVCWENGVETTVNTINLIHKDRIHLEPA